MVKKLWGRQLKEYKSKDLVEGCCFMDGTFVTNVQYLWEDTLDEDEFIKRFSKAYLHEFTHSLLLDIPKKYEYGEERIIRKYFDNDTKWSKTLERFYRNDTTESIPKRGQRKTTSRPK